MNKTIIEKPVVFENCKGRKLQGVLTLPARKKSPAVIIVHGFSGTKSSRKFVEMGRKFAPKGIAVLRFDFAGCGDSEGGFRDLNIADQIKDLEAAYNFLIKQKPVDKKAIGFLGHSFGGLIASLFQAKNPAAKTLVLIAPAFNQKELINNWFSKQELKKWEKKGYIDTPRGRMGKKYLKEAKDYTNVMSQIMCPVLIIHGKNDKDIPLRFSKTLFQKINTSKQIIVLKADHRFEDFNSLKQLINYSLKWLQKTLQ